MVRPAIWALALSSGTIASAQASEARRAITIPAGSLSEALIALSVQTGASIGAAGALPAARVRGFSGTMTVTQALARLLRGTGLTARPTGAMAWRLERAAALAVRPPATAPRRPPPLPPAAPVVSADIVVSATKRDLMQATAPLSVTVIGAQALGGFGAVPGTSAMASLADGLVLTNLGPGRNRSFIRGIADSPFNGATQSTVALEINEARLTFNAPDPDLRLVDIDRVELLEGPQGPLHGTGALGGVYRVIPSAPRLDRIEAKATVSGETVSHGSAGVIASAMVNLPVVTGDLGLRGVVYGGHEPGWIDNAARAQQNSNSNHLQGARLALRWVPTAAWTIDLAGLAQTVQAHDSQYATSAAQPLRRDGALAEPHHNDIYNGRLAIDHRIGDTRLLSVTSWTAQEVDSVLDATAAAAGFGLSGPLLFNDDRRYKLFNQELRASGGGDQLRWLAGLSYLHAVTRLDAELLPVGQSSSITVDRMHQTNSEWAAFGEVSVALGRHVRFDLGARLFRAIAVDERQESSGNQTYTRKHTGFTPSASLSWQASEQTFAYLRYAAAYRPSGLSPFVSADAGAFSPDELSAAELGLRWHSRDRRVRASATGYFNTWSHIQSDYFLANGLVATRNSGMGHIYGLEAKLDWDAGAGWQLAGGIDYQHARLERAEPGLLLTEDHALPIVPPYKAHLALHRDFVLGPFAARGGARLVAIGPSHLSLDPALDRRTGARREVELSVSLTSGGWSLGLDVANALDSRADTFSFGNPFSASSQTQCTPMRPRTLRLTVARLWR